MPIVTVLQGPKDIEQKRKVVKGITDAIVDGYGIPAETVQVWFQDTPPDSWGAAGKLIAD
jgi:4-oxalocrotonate tautomerase